MLHDCNLYQRVVEYFRFIKIALDKPLAFFSAKYLWVLLLVPILFGSIKVIAQESSLQQNVVGSEYDRLSASELIELAEYFEDSDLTLSVQLAQKALAKSDANNNLLTSAKAYRFLGNIAEESNDLKQAAEYFLKGALIYRDKGHKQNYISLSLYYADALLEQKLYDKAINAATEFLPVAQDYGDDFLTGLSFILIADSYYKSKRYEEAISQYSEAVTYLTGHDEAIQKELGNTYKQLAQAYKRLKDREQTVFYYKKALDVYIALRDPKLIARTLNTLAEAERYVGNYVVALDYLIRGLEIHEELDDPEGKAKALMGAGIIYRQIGRYEMSLKHIHKAHLYYKKVNDVSGIAKTSNQMGLIYSKLKQFDQAKSFYQLTVNLPKEQIDLNTLAIALRELAVIDLNNGDFKTAIVMAEKALSIYQEKGDKHKQSLTQRIIGNIYRNSGNEVRAINYYSQSLVLAEEVNSKIYEAKAKTALAGVLISTDADRAIKILKEVIETSTDINDNSQKLYAYRLLVRAEKSKGNTKEALEYAEQEIALTQLIQKEQEKNGLVLAKAQLHSHKMEIELEALREKTKLDHLELVKKNNEIEIAGQAQQISELELVKNKYASIALIALLVICIFLVLFFYRQFMDSKKRNRELDYLAARDPLTNCYNRRVLFDLLHRDFANEESLNEYCVAMIDIDHFKDVNDTYGHSKGDQVLRGVASILQSSVRHTDIVARYGGEEFCVVLPSASQNQTMRISEIIRQKVEDSEIEGINITCSIGVSSIKFDAKTPTELVEQADKALFVSKALGRNHVTLWDESLK